MLIYAYFMPFITTKACNKYEPKRQARADKKRCQKKHLSQMLGYPVSHMKLRLRTLEQRRLAHWSLVSNVVVPEARLTRGKSKNPCSRTRNQASGIPTLSTRPGFLNIPTSEVRNFSVWLVILAILMQFPPTIYHSKATLKLLQSAYSNDLMLQTKPHGADIFLSFAKFRI